MGLGRTPYYWCLIAEHDGSAGGFCLLFFQLFDLDGPPGVYLEDLFVLPEFRGLGIGKALLKRVAAIAVEKDCPRLGWEVLDWNTPAIDFYRAMGAEFLDAWRNVRVTGEALKRLAGVEEQRTVRIRVIGGGLAGPEAALTAARLGCEVDLYEMRAMVDGKPRLTPAHQTTEFGELVCSNSLKSESPNTAPWLLKQEMRRFGSALLRIADETAVPAGHALAVDRVEFSRRIAEAIATEPAIRVIREEVTTLESGRVCGDDCGDGAADVGCAERGDSADHGLGAPGVLRFDFADRGCGVDRHGAGVLCGALGQGHGGLHQLPDESRGVRQVLRCAGGGGGGGEQGVGEAPIFRGLPAD